MPIGSLSMKASNAMLVTIGVLVIAFGFFVSHRVSVLAEDLEFQKAQKQAILTGQVVSSINVKHKVNK